MGVLNYTTRIPAARTVVEMQALLVAAGASRIALDYDDGQPCGLTFALDTPHGRRSFSLPVDVGAMQHLLLAEMKAGRLADSKTATILKREPRAHAEKVAWRVLKDWLEAQLALVATRMVTADQVLLPYLRVDEKHTLYDAYVEHENLALEGR